MDGQTAPASGGDAPHGRYGQNGRPESPRVGAHPEELGAVAAKPPVRQKVVLHFLAALQPYYAPPDSGQPAPRWEYVGLLLSDDPVAVDRVGLDILTTKRREQGIVLPEPEGVAAYLQAACAQYGLGQANLDQITVVTLGPD